MWAWWFLIITPWLASAEVGFYPDIATATIRLPDIYIKVAEWKHTFALTPPCHDSVELKGHLSTTRDSVGKLRNALETPLITIGEPDGYLLTSHKVALKQLIQFAKIILSRLDRCEATLDDRTKNAETLWGWASESICKPTKTEKRAKRSAQVNDDDATGLPSSDSTDSKYESKPNFYGASINQVFVQADARRSDNRFMGAGGLTGVSDVIQASMREQEMLRLENARKFYSSLEAHRSARLQYQSSIQSTETRGDNLPTLDISLHDQDGNQYHGKVRPRNKRPTHTNNVNINMLGRMSNTPLRPHESENAGTLYVRRRRGLDFIGEFYHWFAGIATDSQIRDILALMEAHERSLNLTSEFVATQSRLVQSLSKTVSDEFESLSSIISDTQRAIKQSSTIIDENIRIVVDSINRTTRATEITQALLQTLVELTECDAKVSLLEHALLTSSEFYIYVSDGMVSGNLPLALVPTSRVVEVLKHISSVLPERLALPPTILYDDMLSHIPVKMGVQAGMVIMVMMVPIIKKPTQYQTLVAVTHPVSIKGFWYRARIPRPIYVVNGGTGEWISMSKEDYQLCSRAPYGTCKINHVWSTDLNRDCGAHAVLRGDNIRKVCLMDAVHNEDADQVFITPIGADTWLITHGNDKADLTVICRNGTKTDQTVRVIQGQTRIKLPANCRAKIQGASIEPEQEILDVVQSESIVGDKYVFGPLPEIQIDTTEIKMTAQPMPRLKRAYEILNLTAPVVEGSVAKLANIVADSSNAQEIYHSELEMLANQMAKLGEKIKQDAEEGWSFGSLFKGWLNTLCSIFGIIVLILIIYLIFIIARRCCCAPVALTAASMPLKGFAMTIPSNVTHVATVMITQTPSPTNITSLENWSNVTSNTQSKYIQYTLNEAFHFDLILAVVIMVVTIYWTKRFILSEHRGMLARMGLFSRNLNVTHHMGESSLVIFFLARSSSILGKSHRVFEIPVELCTLPGQALSWTCKPSRGYRPIIRQEMSFYRISRRFTVELDFSNISLKSSEYPNLEGTHNIPDKVSIYTAHLEHILGHHVRWDWTSIRLISVTGLAISFPGVFRYIYHYSKTDIGKHSSLILDEDE